MTETGKLNSVQFYFPTKLIFKENAVNQVGSEASDLGKKALLVTGRKAMKKLGVTAKVKELLETSGIEVITYEEVEPEVSVETVDKGGQLASSQGCDLIVGLGGGSVLDACKGISLVAAQGCSIEIYLEGGEKRGHPLGSNVLPIIAMPTTSGTGSEVTPYALFTDRKERRKKVLADSALYPKRAIIDPVLMMGMSPRLTAITGIDALAHAVESYISRRANTLSDMYAREAILRITKNLPICVADRKDKESQGSMGWASTLAGIANSQVATVAGHAIAVSFGAYFDISHGMAVGFFLPHVLNLNRLSSPEKLADIAVMFEENLKKLSLLDRAKKSVEACQNFIEGVGLPLHFERKVGRDVIMRIAKDAFTKPAMMNNPNSLELDDVVTVIQRVLV